MVDTDIVEKTDFLPDRILKDHGCKNCVWKQHRQCPSRFTKPEQTLKEGFCHEFGEFLISLKESSSSMSEFKEKYFLYSQELQAMSDKMKFYDLQCKYDELSLKKGECKTGDERDRLNRELSELSMAITGYRVWWARLTENIIKGLGRIGDRESRERSAEKGNLLGRSINIQEFNVLLREAEEPKRLEEQK